MIRNPRDFAFVLWASFALSAGGATFTRGPFLQNTSSNSTVIVWKTPAPASTFLEYGLSDTLGSTITNSILETNHVVLLTNLTPDTTYFYRAGSEDAQGALRSEINSFQTFKLSGSIRFQVVGDSPGRNGLPSPDAISVATAMRREEADLVLHSGDLTYTSLATNVDLEFFSVFQPQMKSVPYFLVAGNHDVGGTDLTGEVFQKTFYLPTNSATGTEQFYSFDHGDVHFVGLFNPWFADYVFTSNTVQYQWLTNDLAGTAKPWKVVFMHFPVATSALHATDEYNGNGILDHVEMMQLLAPVFQRYGVQMIFDSHDHDYERFVPTNGFHHVVAGGGGRGLYNLSRQHPASAQFWPVYQFMRVTVTNDTMLVEAVNTNNVVYDSFSITRFAPPPQLWPASWNTPLVETGPANDSDGNINGQSFDFIGPPIPAVTGEFSNLGRVYVNNNATYLFIGFQEAAFYRGNNVFLFIESPGLGGVSSMAGLGNGLVDPAGQGADGLDCLENVSFSNFAPSIGCLLGDEYADGQFRSFARSNCSLNIGQGIFYLDNSLSDVLNAGVQQYNRSPQTNIVAMANMGVNTEQNADYLEIAIPLGALGNVQPGEVIRIGAIVGGREYDSVAQTRQIDRGFLGESLAGSGQGPVVLTGLSVRLAGDPANPDWDGDGLVNDWELAHSLDPYSANEANGGAGDPDHDGMSNLKEQLAGTDPQDSASRLYSGLHPGEGGTLHLIWTAVIGKRYHIQRSQGSLTNFVDLDDATLPRTASSSLEMYEVTPPSSPTFYRIRLVP